ncbi:MAG: glucose 1-dehydrogenase [Rhizomicrobium sp.]
MSVELTGKVALVTGASKGIGAGIAKGLAAAGAMVAVNFNSDRRGAERVVEEIERGGGRAIAIRANIAHLSEVEAMVSETVKAFGRLDILVNNASIFEFMPMADVSESAFRKQFDINVVGTLLVTQQSVKHFPPDGGSVINISSLASSGNTPGSTVYAATKAAVNAMTSVLAIELAARRIRVNGIMPGYTDTEGAALLGVKGTAWETKLLADTPLGRPGLPSDFGPVAVFLASEASGWITGQMISVSGGLR